MNRISTPDKPKYYPNQHDSRAFGMEIPGRSFNSNSYRYGFNGKENDQETGTQDYGFRIYNPNIAKFLSVDPLTAKYPWYTPYQFAGNKPIQFVDVDGLEEGNPPAQNGPAKKDGSGEPAKDNATTNAQQVAKTNAEYADRPQVINIVIPSIGPQQNPAGEPDFVIKSIAYGAVGAGLVAGAVEAAPLLFSSSTAASLTDASYKALTLANATKVGIGLQAAAGGYLGYKSYTNNLIFSEPPTSPTLTGCLPVFDLTLNAVPMALTVWDDAKNAYSSMNQTTQSNQTPPTSSEKVAVKNTSSVSTTFSWSSGAAPSKPSIANTNVSTGYTSH